jgi:peptide/nickel transport system substrate-binding protein
MPFNWIYSKSDLDKDPAFPLKNINGSGPFRFVEHQPGAFVTGKRYEDYHHKGQPFLDGYKSISAPQMAVRLQAIRGDRAAIEFRGFPPKARDDLKAALGDQISVQESDWNCQLLIAMNHQKKPFDDARVRRALMLAIDRWGASENLSKIAIVKTVGGIVFPKHPLASSKERLETYAGYWPDIEKSREEARRLLKEAGAEGLTFELHNRAVDQPYRIIGTWAIGEWKKIGVEVAQRAVPTSPWLDGNRNGTHQVSLDANCQSVVNPLLDVSKYISRSGNPANAGHYEDAELDRLYNAMNQTLDGAEQKSLIEQFEKRLLDEEAHYGMTLWWYKINPYRSYVKGWKISPSHYLNQQLDNIWLDK